MLYFFIRELESKILLDSIEKIELTSLLKQTKSYLNDIEEKE